MKRNILKSFVKLICFQAVIAAMGFQFAFGAVINLHLSWDDNNTDTTVVVSWATTSNDGSIVKYGTTSSYGFQVTGTSSYSSPCGQYIHTAKITGLNPNTIYHYTAGSSSGWSNDYTFATGSPKGSSAEIVFAAGGDSRDNNICAGPDPVYTARRISVMNAILPQNPKFFMNLGDLPECGDKQVLWDEQFTDFASLYASMPTMISWGSHERSQYTPPNNSLDQFVFPANGTGTNDEKYYSFDYGNAHFISLYVLWSTQVKAGSSPWYQIPVGSPQYNWLNDDLNIASKNTNAKWKIVSIHSPPYTSATSDKSNVFLQEQVVPLFENYGVDLVLTAHEHTYERTHFIKNSSVVQSAPKGATINNPAGPIYVVSGGLGGPFNGALGDWFTANYVNSKLHFVLVKINGNNLNLKAIDASSAVIDEITINKSSTPPETVPPTIAITSPANGATVSGTVSVAGNAADNIAVSQVQVQIDGGALSAATGTINWTYSLGTTVLSNASHTITAKASDAAGNSANASVTITANNSIPANSVLNPGFETTTNWTFGAGMARASDRFNTGSWALKSMSTGSPATSQTVAVTANTAYIFSGWIYKGATSGNGCFDMNDITGEIQKCASLTNQWQMIPGTWNSGTRTAIALRCYTDKANNAIWFDDISLSGGTPPPLDTIVPTIAITSPANGATISGTVSIAGTAADNVAVTAVQVSVDGGALVAASGIINWTYSFDTLAISNAAHTVTAKASDAAGNAGTASITINVNNPLPDTTAPTVAITSPANGATFTPSVITISGTATDNVAVSLVQIQVNAGVLSNATGTASWSYALNAAFLSNGTHAITAKALDTAGNSAAATINLTIVPPPDTTAPTIVITSPANSATVSGMVSVAGTAADNAGVSQTQIQIDGGALGAASGTTNWTYMLNTTGLSNANHTIGAKASDAAGNSATVSVIVTVNNPAVTNLVQNPGFEMTTNWTFGAAMARASDRFYSGSWSLKSTSTGSPATNQTITVTANAAYAFSGWIYKSATSGAGCFDMNDITGEIQKCASLTNQWQLITGTWNSGSRTSVVLRCYTDKANNAIWFDDINLKPVGAGAVTATQNVDPISSESKFQLGEVYAYPNPAKGNDKIIFHMEAGLADKVELRIYTEIGEKIKEAILTRPIIVDGKLAYEYELNTSNLASGTYAYVMEAKKAGQETLKSKKWVGIVR